MTYFSRSRDAFPETEVADEIYGNQTESELPLDSSQVFNTVSFVQLEHVTSDIQNNHADLKITYLIYRSINEHKNSCKTATGPAVTDRQIERDSTWKYGFVGERKRPRQLKK